MSASDEAVLVLMLTQAEQVMGLCVQLAPCISVSGASLPCWASA